MTLPLQKQCVSLPLAKRLCELGVEQKSLFYWVEDLVREKPYKTYLKYSPKGMHDTGYISAFTSSEIGEMLPDSIRHDKQYKILTLLKKNQANEKTRRYEDVYGYYYFDVVKGEGCKDQLPQIPSYYVSEADARAKLLIFLIENNLVNVKDL